MSAARTSSRLLRAYPAAWRRRYGRELECLIVEASEGGRVPWRTRLDIALGGGRERLRESGLGGDGSPAERARGGALLVLCAWALFVVGGVIVQKFSEHWQSATPDHRQGLPAAAFACLIAAACLGSALILAGTAAAVPAFRAFLRSGGWREIRRPAGRAALISGLFLVASGGLVAWASGLEPHQREGHDLGFAVAFLACAALGCACLGTLAATAVAIGRRLELSPTVLRIEAGLAVAVAVLMATMTADTIVWWVSLANSAPWFLAGRPAGSSGSALPVQLLAATMPMVLATTAAGLGSWRAGRAVLNAGDPAPR